MVGARTASMIAAKTTRWFEMKDPNLLLVGSSRRLWVIAPEILHTCSMSLCQPVIERFFLFCFVFFRQILFVYLFGISGLKE